MVESWESVDLTLTSDSDGESSLPRYGDSFITYPRPKDAERLHGHPADVSFNYCNSYKFHFCIQHIMQFF